jgi:hypothetical protein
VSSIEPNDGGGEVDGGEKVASGLVVASSDGTKLLEPGEEVFDQMACLEEVSIVVAADRSIGLGRDDRGLAGCGERLDDPLIGIERLIGDQGIGLHGWQEVVGAVQIMRLATGQMETDRIAQCIDQRMDLGAQSAARTTDRLVFASFFWAPALC